MNHLSLFTFLSIWLTLEKSESQELPLENSLSVTLQQKASNEENPSESPQLNAVDINNKSKPQVKDIVVIKLIILYLCYRRLNMLKNPKNFNQSHLFLPSINILKNRMKVLTFILLVIVVPYRKPSRESRHTFRSHSRFNSRSRYFDRKSPNNLSSTSDGNRSRYDQLYRKSNRNVDACIITINFLLVGVIESTFFS